MFTCGVMERRRSGGMKPWVMRLAYVARVRRSRGSLRDADNHVFDNTGTENK